MSITVNPPPQLKRPKEIRENKALEVYFRQLEFIIFQLYEKTGGGVDLVDQAGTVDPTSNAFVIDINQRLGSGDALTSDETGFTVDLDTLSVDMDEA